MAKRKRAVKMAAVEGSLGAVVGGEGGGGGAGKESGSAKGHRMVMRKRAAANMADEMMPPPTKKQTVLLPPANKQKKTKKTSRTKFKATTSKAKLDCGGSDTDNEEDGSPADEIFVSAALKQSWKHQTRSQTRSRAAAEVNEEYQDDQVMVASDGESEVEMEYVTQWKDDIPNAFNGEVEAGKDYISAVPPEILGDILSYLILDNDPEHAVRFHADPVKFREVPHVLTSLAAMSKHMRDNVEDFSRRWLTERKHWTFKTNEQLKAKEDAKDLRRSERLKSQPLYHSVDQRCYRLELTQFLRTYCYVCDAWTMRRCIFASKVVCCRRCEHHVFPGEMKLSDAMHEFDLRDWMLVASRKLGPKAKHVDIPVINYGTIRCGTPYYNGMCISYRFQRKDVEKVARAVHGNVEEHMVKKIQEREQRSKERRKTEIRNIYEKYKNDINDIAKSGLLWIIWDRLGWPDDPDEDFNIQDDTITEWTAAFVDHHFGPFSDEHRRICPIKDCDYCEEGKLRKYVPWW